jgi:uncharacterized repeat protein (TIGR03803 family)
VKATLVFLSLAGMMAFVTPPTLGTPVLTLIHSFGSGTDGMGPTASLIANAAGALFGTTVQGGVCGSSSSGCGTVFRLMPAGSSYAETFAYNFQGSPDGAGPKAPLVADAGGALYGTTAAGGTATQCSIGCGTVFKLTPSGSGYAESVVYRFAQSATDGNTPLGALVIDGSGSLYGTTDFGGKDGRGTVFRLTPSRAGYTEKILHSFRGNGYRDGSNPAGALLIDKGGALYGTTVAGGIGGSGGNGTVFRLSPSGATYKETVLHVFNGSPADGTSPTGTLVADTKGVLYGTTAGGGTSSCSCGTVFELVPTRTGYRERILYNFQGGNDGSRPNLDMIRSGAGSLYGTTSYGGGSANWGTVFALVHSKGRYTESILHSFQPGAKDGGLPQAGLIADTRGALYGTTALGGTAGGGTAFHLTP